MANSKQQGAVAAVSSLVTLCQQFAALRTATKTFVDQYNSEGWSTVWNAMATAAQNADGSLGTADGTPNTAHPITVQNINKTATQLVAGVTLLNDFLSFCQNVAVSTAQRSQSIDDLAS